MKIFHLHCDTIEALKKHNETFDNSTTQFTMKGQENLEKAVQFLAVWLPDHLRGQEAVDYINAYYEYMKGTRHGWDLNAVPNLKLGER